MNLTDFNDLYCASGGDAVRAQVLAALDDGPVVVVENEPSQNAPESDSPPPPVIEVARFSITELLQRFSLAMPDGKIWDAVDSRFIKKGAARDWWGEKCYKEWLAHESRATVMQDDVAAFAAAAQLRGRGGLGDALNRYIYIYPTADVWDISARKRVPCASLKLAIADVYEGWLKHPSRRDIDNDALVFDPGGPLQQSGRINTFRGLPFDGKDDSANAWKGCENIRELIWHLSNRDEEIYWWILKWLAYPLQHVGAKMASALLLHSDIQGSGKSLLFEEVIKPMYGEYGSTLGQHQLESQYTDWKVSSLFALFEEIFSGATKFAHTGQIKQMITGKTHRIEKKFVSGWEEANHMNAVFLSNETQPFPLDPSDRRMLVLWPRQKLTDELKAAVLSEIAAGCYARYAGRA